MNTINKKLAEIAALMTMTSMMSPDYDRSEFENNHAVKKYSKEDNPQYRTEPTRKQKWAATTGRKVKHKKAHRGPKGKR